MKGQAADASAVLSELGISKAHVFGHSTGGSRLGESSGSPRIEANIGAIVDELERTFVDDSFKLFRKERLE